MIDGDTAHEIEVLNLANQANVIEALVRYFIHHKGVETNGCPVYPAKTAIKELHRTATFLLLSRPGEFRDETDKVVVPDNDGKVVFTPPISAEVEEQLDKLYGLMAEKWIEGDALELAALALWMVNYVHPFKNGNGRTARAFSYTCLSLKLGFVPQGHQRS